MKYYMIANVGTYLNSHYSLNFPQHLFLVQQFKTPGMFGVAHQIKANGGEIILDNGAYESIDLDLQFYGEVIREIQPDWIVLPDKPFSSAEESRAISLFFLKQLQDREITNDHYDPKYIYVPQGQCIDEVISEFVQCSHRFKSEYFRLAFGLAYKLWDSRMDMVVEVLDADIHPDTHFHLLGARWDPVPFGGINKIKGIDTIKPLRSAVTGADYPIYGAKIDHQDPVINPIEEVYKDSIAKFCEYYGAEI